MTMVLLESFNSCGSLDGHCHIFAFTHTFLAFCAHLGYGEFKFSIPFTSSLLHFSSNLPINFAISFIFCVCKNKFYLIVIVVNYYVNQVWTPTWSASTFLFIPFSLRLKVWVGLLPLHPHHCQIHSHIYHPCYHPPHQHLSLYNNNCRHNSVWQNIWLWMKNEQVHFLPMAINLLSGYIIFLRGCQSLKSEKPVLIQCPLWLRVHVLPLNVQDKAKS